MKFSHGRFTKEQFKELNVLARKSVVTPDSTLSIQVAHTTAQIELLDSQLEHIEAKITEIMKFNDSVMILGEIHRFSSPSKLLAFAELDPTVYQYSNYHMKHTRISKRGSRTLRYALINATNNVFKNNATFKAYYNTKTAKGQTHYNILKRCAYRLVKVI